jgi:mono/diheme cytochrome c family protein
MKRNLTLVIISTMSALVFFSCDSDDNNSNDDGFVAGLSDFNNYQSWDLVDYTISDIPGLAGAHGGGDDAFSRLVYKHPDATMTNGEFAEGAILVKETFSWNAETGAKEFADSGGLLAMVKRGADFNPDFGGWEWFMLATDGTAIAGQGADLMDGMCNSCHNGASNMGGMDFTFAHPSEYIADAADFADFETWELLDETSADHPFLNPAHQGEEENATRRVYRKQFLANPNSGAYPIGTTIVKTVEMEGSIVEITAMVKRGADFNSSFGQWEWFMLNPATLAISGQGADLMNGMCNGCHTNANSSGVGLDYVFSHPDDPFNN